MTEKEDRTVSGLAQSRDLFESQDEDNLKRSQYCVSDVGGGRGREGKIGTPLHRLFYNMHGISSLCLLAG